MTRDQVIEAALQLVSYVRVEIMPIKRCKCGEQELEEMYRWVAFAHSIHAEQRCGVFAKLELEHQRSPGAPLELITALNIFWPDGETTTVRVSRAEVVAGSSQ